jgi:hypothetical protein
MKGIIWIDVDNPWWTSNKDSDYPLLSVGKGINLTIEKLSIRPGERWNEVLVDLIQDSSSINEKNVILTLFDIGKPDILEKESVVPKSRFGRLLIDLRRHDLEEARLSIEFFVQNKCLRRSEAILSASKIENPLKPDQKITINIDLPSEINTLEKWPVCFGVPFASGAIWDLNNLSLVNDIDQDIPHQKEITALWAPDGSIKWVRFDTFVSSSKNIFVKISACRSKSKPKPSIEVIKNGDEVLVRNGKVVYLLSKDISPIKEIWFDKKLIVTSKGTRGLYLVDQKDRLAIASSNGANLEVEADGPVSACIRIEGYYRTDHGEQLARHITRVEFFAGLPFAKIIHTLTVTNDTRKIWFKDVGWEFAVVNNEEVKAFFNNSRKEPTKFFSQTLGEDKHSIFMIQNEHYRFGRGNNHFYIASDNQENNSDIIFEGEEMGDWALLSGKQSGFLVSCRESAKQHPKEFEVFQDRIVLRLFSNRAGEELDFRPETLVKKWNLDIWLSPEECAQVTQNESNAVGWSKTHEILISPIQDVKPERVASLFSQLNTYPIYANVDPYWIWKTRVLGPLYPRDPTQFPAAEEFIDAVFDYWNLRRLEPGQYGFVDYNAGPVCWGMEYHLGYFWGLRYRYTYTLRPDLWFLYARSGCRNIREFAEGTNRAFLDNYLAHWDAPNKTKGLYLLDIGSERGSPTTPRHLPFYWQNRTTLNLSGSTDLNQFMLDYYLTGYRRAKDAVIEFAEGLKRAWTPEVKRHHRIIMVLRVLTQTYAFTFDPKLRELAERTTNFFHDPTAELSVTQQRRYVTNAWKTETDLAAILEAWEVFGTRRYHEMTQKIANFWWYHNIGSLPNDKAIGYTNPIGQIGNFLYKENGDLSIPSALDFHIRWAITGYNTKSKEINYYVGRQSADVSFVFRGISYAQDILMHAKTKKRGSWVAFSDNDSASTIIFFKKEGEVVDLTVRNPRVSGEICCPTQLKPLKMEGKLGQDLTRIWGGATLAERIRVPKDKPEGAYEIFTKKNGFHFVVAKNEIPLVIHCPKGFHPINLRPQVKYYFKVPENIQNAEIYFEGSAQLYYPDGKNVRDPINKEGWCQLPRDKPGLWSFQPIECSFVKVRNIPPFFAMQRAENYFKPDISG